MTNFILHSNFKPAGGQPESIVKLVSGLANNFQDQVLLGVTGCGKTFVLANVIATTQRPTLIIAHNKTLAAQLYGEMREFFPKNSVQYFVSYYDYYQPEAYIPATNTYIEKDASINEQIEQMRLSATKSLFERNDTIIVASVSAIYGLGDPKSYQQMVLRFSCGDVIDQRALLRQLTELQYGRNDVELHRGSYRVHGDIIDIFPAESEKEGVRLEIFDKTLEQISFFDPLTGKVVHKVSHVTIYPKTHYVTQRQTVLDAVDLIKIELKARLDELYKANKLLEAQRLKERAEYDIEMLLELGYCTGIENYSRFLSKRQAGEPPPTLMDYLPRNALLVIDESHVTVPQIGAMYQGDKSRKTTLVEYGFRLPSALDNRPLKFSEFQKIAPQTIYVSATPGPYEKTHAQQIVEVLVRPTGLIDPEVEIRSAKTQIDDLLSEINKRVTANERVLVTTLTKRNAEDLTDYFAEHGVKVRYLHADIVTVERTQILHDLRLGMFDVLVGINLLREGLDLPEVSLVAILDADKEGFLRSTQSLIQTSGRAARNLHGKVIMYAERITQSMQRALDEMERRRNAQIAYNELHHITPIGISKAVHEIMVATSEESGVTRKQGARREQTHYADYTPKKLSAIIVKLEKKMFIHARNLEFEEAAQVRDEIKAIREQLLFEKE